MRNWMAIILALILGGANVDASSILPPKIKEVKPEPISKILYPHGQQSTVEPAFVTSVSYLGGGAGQMERRVGTSGVISPRTVKGPSSGSIISAPASWANGFELNFCGSTPGQGSNSFKATYSILTSSSSPSTTASGSATTPGILPSFALNNLAVTSPLATSVTSYYNMPSFQDALFSFSRSLFANEYLSIMIMTGLHGFALNHRMSVAYKDTSGGVTTLKMSEATYGAGPLIGFCSTKLILPNFAIRGILLASAPLSNHALGQSDYYVHGGTKTIGYNASSTNQLRQHLVLHLDLEAIFRADLLFGTALEFLLCWHVKQYVNQSYLTTMSNNQNAPPSSVQVNTIKAGLAFIF